MLHDQDPVFSSYRWIGHNGFGLTVPVYTYALGGTKENPEMELFFKLFQVEGTFSILGYLSSVRYLKFKYNLTMEGNLLSFVIEFGNTEYCT